jgi:hypothetical protein
MIFSFVSIVVVYEGCQVNGQCQIPLSTSVRNVIYAQKSNIVMGLVCGDNTIWVFKD